MYSARDMNDIMDLFDGINTGKQVTIGNAWTFATNPVGVSITDKTKLPSDAVYAADVKTLSGKTMDWNANTFQNFPFNPAGAGTGAPTSPNTYSALQTFRDLDFALRNPANTYTLTFKNPTITADSTFQFNSPPQMYVFIDPDDGLYKARDGKTGAIISSHATNADVPLQAAIDALYAGSTVSLTGADKYIAVGGRYGVIAVGPGIFYLHNNVILRTKISIIGAGRWATIFKWPDSLLLRNNNQNMFASAGWKTGQGKLALGSGYPEDFGVRLSGFTIDGNKANNAIPAANTNPTLVVGGVETVQNNSWGHGIAYYGYDLWCEDLFIRHCPGCGIIIQGGNGGFNGVPDTNPGLSHIFKCNCDNNGMQGMCIREWTYIDHFISSGNGEAGLDFQSDSGNFSGSGWVTNCNIYGDGNNHGVGGPWYSGGSGSSVYDPLAFEMRVTGGGVWIENAWIEAPNGPGDNLVVGDVEGGASVSALSGGGGITMVDTQLDNPHYSCVRIGYSSNGNILNNIHLIGDSEITIPASMDRLPNGIYLAGSNGNQIRCYATRYHTNVNALVVLGEKYVTPGKPSWSNLIDISSDDTQDFINWAAGTGAGVNNANCILIRTDSASSAITQGTQKIIKAGSSGVDYVNNRIEVQVAGSVPGGFYSQSGGTASLSANGSLTTFTVAHGLLTTPLFVETRAKNSAAATAPTYYVTADGTNITFTFTSAPSTGTLSYWWSAKINLY